MSSDGISRLVKQDISTELFTDLFINQRSLLLLLHQSNKEMDTRIIKFLVAALSLYYTTTLFINGSWGTGIFMILVSAVLVLVCVCIESQQQPCA